MSRPVDALIAHRKIAAENHQSEMAHIDRIIADLVAQEAKSPVDNGHRLDIPWLSQLGDTAGYAPGDCGTAVVAMWLQSLAYDVTVDMVSRATGKAKDFCFTTVGNLTKVASKWNLPLIWSRNQTTLDIYGHIDRGDPVIALVYYPALPTRFDPNYPWCHWILVTGYDDGKIFYHDPYYREPKDGAHVEISEQDFIFAWSSNYKAGNSNRQMLSKVK